MSHGQPKSYDFHLKSQVNTEDNSVLLKFKLLLFLLLDVYILKSANSKQEGSTFELDLKKLDNTSI